jgi:hypothetical protein
MIGTVVIKSNGAVRLTDARLARADMNRILKESWREPADHWHGEMLPRHFTHGAAQRYGYQTRTKAYNIRKRRIFGHTRELVFTGQGRALTRIKRITSTSKGCRVRMQGARVFNFRRRREDGKLSPDMKSELRTITTSEQRRLVRVLDKAIDKRLKQQRSGSHREQIR